MTAHLVLVALGPVQEFIAQARRTRDLWYGSHLLSELGRAAARALVDGGAKLIFPALEAHAPELVACPGPLRADATRPRSIANKLLAEVPAGTDPRELARTTRQAVTDYWCNELAAPVRTKCAELLASDIDAVWTEQLATFLEFSASWLPLGEYKSTRRQLERAIAGRKLLRDFDPWKRVRGDVPKSSLDGARETVLLPPKKRPNELVRRYRIGKNEQLDAIGLVKRAGGEPNRFVPVINVALACWLDRAQRVAPKELAALKQACHEARVARVARALPCVAAFGFDGSLLLPNRWRAVFDEQGLQGDAEAWGRRHVRPLLDKALEPYPYVACLVADGDQMGRAIDRIDSAEAHRAFSAALASFAVTARALVEQQHRGALVYAGGDDVLAFVALPEALSCADALRRAFEGAMAAACGSHVTEHPPTLSVGIGIGHVMESMGDLLDLGRDAERVAKRDRNALAVIVDKRSGGTQSWCAPWTSDPVRQLAEAAALLQDRLPTRKVYEIATLLSRLPKPDATPQDGWARVLALEVKRILARADGAGLHPEEVGLALDVQAGYAALSEHVDHWVRRLIIARTFGRAERPARFNEEHAA